MRNLICLSDGILALANQNTLSLSVDLHAHIRLADMFLGAGFGKGLLLKFAKVIQM